MILGFRVGPGTNPGTPAARSLSGSPSSAVLPHPAHRVQAEEQRHEHLSPIHSRSLGSAYNCSSSSRIHRSISPPPHRSGRLPSRSSASGGLGGPSGSSRPQPTLPPPRASRRIRQSGREWVPLEASPPAPLSLDRACPVNARRCSMDRPRRSSPSLSVSPKSKAS